MRTSLRVAGGAAESESGQGVRPSLRVAVGVRPSLRVAGGAAESECGRGGAAKFGWGGWSWMCVGGGVPHGVHVYGTWVTK